MSYITFKTIGEAGDLGSQVQQYASLYAVAKHNQLNIVFPESSLKLGYGFKFAQLLDIEIKTMPDSFFVDFIDVRPDDTILVDEKVFSLDSRKNYNIINRFDSYRYWFTDYKDDVFSWDWNADYYQHAVSLYNNIKIEGKQTVAIHVRRGDYLLPQHDHFCKLDVNYYGKALEPFFDSIDSYQFIIFSNDIEWCKDHLIEESDIVSFVQPGSDYVDMMLMSLCDHQIIANSSYSWWAAFKNHNPNKKITCPRSYLKSYSLWSHINGNYYPKDWISINNTTL
jgi:hypothetical protein